MSKTLDVTVRLGPEVRAKFLNAPEEVRVTPDESAEVTAMDEIVLPYHFGVSNIVLEAVDWEDKRRLNYFGDIDPCPPWPIDPASTLPGS
jgi:hypothetical protein